MGQGAFLYFLQSLAVTHTKQDDHQYNSADYGCDNDGYLILCPNGPLQTCGTPTRSASNCKAATARNRRKRRIAIDTKIRIATASTWGWPSPDSKSSGVSGQSASPASPGSTMTAAASALALVQRIAEIGQVGFAAAFLVPGTWALPDQCYALIPPLS